MPQQRLFLLRKWPLMHLHHSLLFFSNVYLTMSQVATNSNIARSMERIASLMASAERKRIRNDQASDREHRRLMSKVEHELDDASGSGCIRRRGLARIKNNSLAVPAERKGS